MTPVSAETFDAAVDAVERRARHLLAREAEVGASTRITGKARVRDGELHERLMRLNETLHDQLTEALKVGCPATGKDAGDLWHQLLAQVAEALPQWGLWRMTEAETEQRLLGLHDGLEDLLAELDTAARHLSEELADDGATLHLLTPVEIEVFFEQSNRKTRTAAGRLGALVGLDAGFRRIRSEVRALIAGRFQWQPGQMGPHEKRRGRWFAAHLIGIAEGLGLAPSRNHAPQPERSPRSAIDAYLAALDRIAPSEDPAAAGVLAEAPKTFEAVVRRLVPASDPTRDGDPVLPQARKVGRLLGSRTRETAAPPK